MPLVPLALLIAKILDDFHFTHNSYTECRRALFTFLALCEYLGIPVAEHKTVLPTLLIVFLGISLDSANMIAQLPIDKLEQYKQDVEIAIRSDELTLRDLRSLLGKLQFSTSVVTCGRPFLRRLYDLTKGAVNPCKKISIDDDAKSDLKIWLSFLNNYNGRSIIYKKPVHESDDLHFFSDSSKTAFGGQFGKDWIHGFWPEKWSKEHINLLEMYPIFALVKLFSSRLKNRSIVFHCDNEAIVNVINNQTCTCPKIMNLVRPFVLELLYNNVLFKAVWIPGVDNIISDFISRTQDLSLVSKRFGLRQYPVPIPQDILPGAFQID